MKDFAYVMPFAAAVLIFQALRFVQGYFVVFLPFHILTPIVILGLMLFMLVAALVLVLQLMFGKAAISKRALVFSVAVAFTVIASQIPSTDDAFRYRMGQMQEDDWIALSRDARAMLEANGALRERSIIDPWNRTVVERLSHSYPLLSVGDWPPKLLASDHATSFYWGSGMVGTLGVDVLEPGVTPRSSIGYYRYIKLYPRVILVLE